MATQESVAWSMVACFQDAGDISTRKMFGEYCVYLFGKPVALICDDHLFVQPTDSARKILKTIDEAPPFPGAKPRLRVAEAEWKQKGRMSKLLIALYKELPDPKPRKRKNPAKKRSSMAAVTPRTLKKSKPARKRGT